MSVYIKTEWRQSGMENNDVKKWEKYEKRWRFRDFYFNKCLRRHGIVKCFHREPVMPHYAHKWVMSSKKTNDYIYDRIISGEPFMACRFGNTELQTVVGNLKVKILVFK